MPKRRQRILIRVHSIITPEKTQQGDFSGPEKFFSPENQRVKATFFFYHQKHGRKEVRTVL